MTSSISRTAESTSGGWRFNLGIAIVALMLALWLLVPLAAMAGTSAGTIATITGALFIINKVLLLLVIAVLGKPGFQQLKRHLFGYVTALAPDAMVSPLRHRIGLVMFWLPLVSAFLEPYVDSIAPGLRPNLWQLQLLGDVLFIGSFFILGGNFWDKIRALFVRTARVVDPGS
jgi:hypothetical protein